MRTWLFDLDGTLTDPYEGIVGSIRYALERLGLPCEWEDFHWFVGPPLHLGIARLLDTDDRSRIEEGVRLYRVYYGESGKFENYVYPGIQEALTELRSRGERLYVATSKVESFSLEIVEKLGLSQHIQGLVGSTMDGSLQHKADILAELSSRYQVNLDEATMVGDRAQDVAGAREHGIPCVGVLWGYGTEQELRTAGADLLIDRPSQLPSVGDLRDAKRR